MNFQVRYENLKKSAKNRVSNRMKDLTSLQLLTLLCVSLLLFIFNNFNGNIKTTVKL